MASRYAVSERTGRWVLFSTILASSMAFIDSSALSVALAALQDDLNATGAQLIWVVNAYLLFLASLMLIGGSLGDHYGRKKIFTLGIVIFALSSLAAGLSPSVEVLIGARAVQGVGGALMVPGSLAIITAVIQSGDRGKAIGIWSAVSTITTIGGPILGGILAGAGLWRFVFFINLPLAALALYGLQHVPENRDENAPNRIDYPGTVLTVLGMAGMTYSLIEMGDRGVRAALGDPLIVIAFLTGVLALIVFVFVEYRSPHPLVPLRLFRSRTFAGANLMTAFLYGALYGALVFLPLNLIQIQGYDASIAGLVFLPFDIMLAVLSPWAGSLMDRIGPRIPLTVGPAIVGVAFLLLAAPGLTAGPSDYWTTYLPGILVFGVGMGITVAPLTTAVMSAVPSTQSGTASGINNAVTRLSQALATAALGAVALTVFTGALADRTTGLDLSPAMQQEVEAQGRRLADAEPPADLSTEQQAQVQSAIDRSFVEMFRVVLIIAAAMAFLSAILAGILVESNPAPPEEVGEREAETGVHAAGVP
ncbi:MAG: MFS transporter [Chloroflexi bacterium]|nr:MFS transporter [Chloroflexota bacterium]